MNIHYDGELLTTTLHILFRGSLLKIDDVIIDTGSSHTIFSPDVLEKIGVTYENGDPIYEAYGIGGTAPFYIKTMDEIRIGNFILKDQKIDVGILPEGHHGLLGLDILVANNFLLDLKQLSFTPSPDEL